MKLTFAGVVADAWALFRRDAALLLSVAAPLMFLPAYALTLLVPPMPMPDDAIADPAARAEAWSDLLSHWVGDYGLGFALAYAVGYFGWAVVVALYCDRDRPDVGGALRRAATIFPRFILAMLLVSLPAGAGLWIFILPGLYVVGRTLPTASVLIGERPIGVLRAIRRALALTRGNGIALMGVAAFAYLGGLLGGQPFLLFDHWLRLQEGGNPVAVAMVDALAAGVAMLTQLALALAAVGAYRRLAR